MYILEMYRKIVVFINLKKLKAKFKNFDKNTRIHKNEHQNTKTVKYNN